jgi:hypothetical protein
MEPKNDGTPPGQPKAAQPPPVAKKRFRIVKLEERVAPAKGGNGTHKGSGTSSGISFVSSY